MRIAFLGLGVMGFHMAGHLSRAGYNVNVYNRNQAQVDKWLQQFNGTGFNTPIKAVQNADMVMMCLKDDASLREVLLSDNGVLANMKADSLLIDHTTASAQIARELGILAPKHQVSFLDAPISGGEVGAQNGQLAIMVGGNEQDFIKAEPILKAYAKQIQLMGEHGTGQLTKMVNQICIAGLVQALAEGVNFAQKAGLNLDKAMAIIGQGAAGSWQLSNRYQSMVKGEFNFGFAVDLMRKDLNLALTEASLNGASLPITAVVDQFYADVQAQGGGKFDTCSLITRFK